MSTIPHEIEQHPLLKAVLSAISEGFMLLNSELKVLVVNEYLKKLFGGDTPDKFNKSIGQTIHCVRSERNSCHSQGACQKCQIVGPTLAALKGQPVRRRQMDLDIRLDNKVEIKKVLFTALPFDYQNEKCIIVLIDDITELSMLRDELEKKKSLGGIIGDSDLINELRENIRILSQTDVPVMIQGESGTGKELVARAIHHEGKYKNNPFIAVNCGALADNLLESELFGHVKGAFTGAIRDRKGRFEMAQGGTIFLDEIGDISPAMQVKLLRVLQEGTFEPLGSEKTLHIQVRVLSATNKDIQKEINAGRFRKDLYYRLCVVPLFVSPLKERAKDIPVLAHYFMEKHKVKIDRPNVRLSDSALQILKEYHWPGNVRELENAIQHSLVKCKGGFIEPDHLPNTISSIDSTQTRPRKRKKKKPVDKNDLEKVILKANGSKTKAAKMLGVSRATFYRYLEETEDRE